MTVAETILRGLPWLAGGVLFLGWAMVALYWFSDVMTGFRSPWWRHLLGVSFMVTLILGISYGIGTTVKI